MRIFSLSAMFYLGVSFVSFRWVNVVLLALALMSVGCGSALLWSVYVPGIGKTVRVSGIDGILDCTGYIVAALSNLVFSVIAGYLNRTGVVFLWGVISLAGLIASLSQKRKVLFD